MEYGVCDTRGSINEPLDPINNGDNNVALPVRHDEASTIDMEIDDDQPCTSRQARSHMEVLHHEKTNKQDSQDPNDIVVDVDLKSKTVNIYIEDTGPKWYHTCASVDGLITPSFLPTKLEEAFEFLAVHGSPRSKEDLEEFNNDKIREFIGCDINDEEYEKLSRSCSPEHLRTGQELVMREPVPNQEKRNIVFGDKFADRAVGNELCIVKKCRMRISRDLGNLYVKRLKYRGIRLLQESSIPPSINDTLLEPGKDILIRFRIYRPFPYSLKDRPSRSRHSVFSRDVVLVGRQRVSELRDRLICENDVDMRVEVSEFPNALPPGTAKEAFPSGFLFINNVFYVDTRGGAQDHSAIIRAWAARRGLGVFPRRNTAVLLRDMPLRLGHPEVYVHQGNCEHLFTVSEVRLVSPSDPLLLSQYPRHTAIAQNQSIYCTTCAEFVARWIVTGGKVPFDPAFFCETCFKMYLYKDGKKVGDFKAYLYRGNELSLLKPQG